MECPCQFAHCSCYPGSICAEAGQKMLQVSLKGGETVSDKAIVIYFFPHVQASGYW